MLETTITVASLITDAAAAMTAIIGNGSGVTLIVGITAGVAGVGLLVRWLLRAAKSLRRV